MAGSIVVLAGCALVAGLAGAHAVLQRSEPGADSSLKRPPEEVRLYFSERLEPAYSTLRVLDARDGRVDERDARVDRANPTLLRATLPSLPAGRYRVRWRVISIDADATEGEFTFRIE